MICPLDLYFAMIDWWRAERRAAIDYAVDFCRSLASILPKYGCVCSEIDCTCYELALLTRCGYSTICQYRRHIASWASASMKRRASDLHANLEDGAERVFDALSGAGPRVGLTRDDARFHGAWRRRLDATRMTAALSMGISLINRSPPAVRRRE